MRVAAGCLVLAASAAWGQTWTKALVPGLSYSLERVADGPRMVHVLRWTPGRGVTAKPEVAGGRIYALPTDKGRERVGDMVERTGALGGVNADFFPFTGDPLGAMIRDGELISRPDPRRVVLTWTGRRAEIVRAQWTASATIADQPALSIDGLNEECPENGLILVTGAAAQAWTKAPNVVVPVRLEAGQWRPTARRSAETLAPVLDQERVDVPKGGALLVARGFKAAILRNVQPGTPLWLSMRTVGLDNAVDRQAAGGGPNLVTGGRPDITGAAEGLGNSFEATRHPRTAVGITRTGDLIFVVVDGRQPMSVGMSLAEQAALMMRLGCVSAMNFDGGGSSALNYLGVTLNRPSDGEERPVANAVLFFGERPEPTRGPFSLDGPLAVPANGRAKFRVVQGSRPIPPEQVLWSAMGDAWIDGAGNLTGLRPGAARITALHAGTRISLRVPVTTPIEPAKPGP